MHNIRNFCIIAHIDHGKSTLADRLLEATGSVEPSKMRHQILDSMDLERERGITIKLQPARMTYELSGERYILNLIDTPGHVDFSYEVSRSLAAVEGAILLVDATRGIQAQTLATLAAARSHNLAIVPVVNKIDLPGAETERVAFEIADVVGCSPDDVLLASGKTGQGVDEILKAVVMRVPAPLGSPARPLKALVFDSQFNSYRGVIAYVRVVEGTLFGGQEVMAMAESTKFPAEEVGTITLELKPASTLAAGEIGYVVSGLKQVAQCRVGETLTNAENPADKAVSGYRQPQAMVFASVFTAEEAGTKLRPALEKLSANDASLLFEPIHSEAFGSGFRVGFLGLLHLEVTKERLEREHHLDIIVTSPVAAFRGDQKSGYEEPWVRAEIVSPSKCVGAIMDLSGEYRGRYVSLDHLGSDSGFGADSKAILVFEFPLAEIIVDFHDRLKSVTTGYASMAYELIGYRPGNLVELTIAIAGEKIAPFTQLVPASLAERRGRQMALRLKELIPRQQFEVSIQAMVGGRIVARETVSAMRKDVTAKLYGGDVTRKRKLLEKQKKGKKRLKQFGAVSLPTSVFIEALKISR